MRRRPPMEPKQKVKLFCFFFSCIFIALAVVATMHLRSILGSLAVTRVTNMVNQVVTEAVSEAVNSGEIQYHDLITLEKNDSGGVAALVSNMAEFNRLQSSITRDILQRLEAMSDIELTIPVGTLSGSAFLAGRGPALSVRTQSTGSCSAWFENEFSHAGINQTTHRILLCVDVSMSILLPGFRTGTEISNAFSVAETVIVGEVPGTYTYFDSGNATEEDAYEYAINNG